MKITQEDIEKFVDFCKKNNYNKIVPGQNYSAMNRWGTVATLINGKTLKIQKINQVYEAEFQEDKVEENENILIGNPSNSQETPQHDQGNNS